MKREGFGKIVPYALVVSLFFAAIGGVSAGGQSASAGGTEQKGSVELLNVSYDPTRELYREYNDAFAKYYKDKTGVEVTIRQSHGGSGGQARGVIEGNEADVVTLALAYDVMQIGDKAGIIDSNWQTRLPNNSSPYTSTIVFLVRAGNPKNIKDWDDLVKSGVQIITPDPKTSGGAQWNYLAAYAFAKEKYGSDAQAREFVKQLYNNVPVLDSGARGATNTFVQRGLGDVLLAWENEAFLSINELGKDQFEIVVPSLSILAEPTVSWVDGITSRHGTLEVAKEYLSYLYSDEGQRIAGRNYYRPSNPQIAQEFVTQFPNLKLVHIDDYFGGWRKVHDYYFSDGGEFDTIIAELKKK
ncbi:sulfate-binding protein (Sulfate starvation-induced protein2) (SSI2) [Treponema primitia ZAS-2]|uniref:Sulfate-binding protein (Sulfate starvation-induced protein2) (SSI2) n=1 Tax=Treponema primitia (strain ATCC BAA-887 / DSM 12427 / ZAS-2) TaxID=545694 RepID=F5YLJ1_TREPZ|nr:sulfate ABC transporter substrate-binding protein [Treponema primitia]AEF83745.1 sulfate-binding protein (Sulfate starvation-induced protein2) (SSI2) [Treponema primitia ZAS-2]